MMNTTGRCFATTVVLLLTALTVSGAPSARANDDSSNTKYRLALNFNEAMNRCLQSGCPNIEEVIGFFTPDATYIDEGSQIWSGKAAIRKRLARTSTQSGVSDSIEGINVWGAMITLRLERRWPVKGLESKGVAEIKPHLQVIILNNGRIARLISVIPPDEK